MPARSLLRLCCLVTALALAVDTPFALAADEQPADQLPPAVEKKIDFIQEIRPILAARCYECHGPDEQESGLRLDLKKSALAGGDSGKVIIIGKSSESTLIHLIAGLDPESKMPPEGEPLSKEQVGIFRAWIDQGADWPKRADVDPTAAGRSHWAFQPLRQPAEPALGETKWGRNPIDSFVLARLNERGISPSPEAARHTLIRRLSLDLLGLPPRPEDIDGYMGDTSNNAYERLVDRLLESDHFGERWGRHWLDKARYADSDGYEKDRARPNAWRWRDWVIRAINDDLPFDRFTIEQLAGDLLPNATDDQKLATAFHRQTLTNTEGGTDKEQWRVEAVFDRVETTGTVWMGLTIGCARCHSHKYDPIAQREYYRLFAFFNNGDETGTSVPISEAEVARFETETAQHTRDIQAFEKRIAEAGRAARAVQSEWETDTRAAIHTASNDPPRFHSLGVTGIEGSEGTGFSQAADGSIVVGSKNADKATYTLLATAIPTKVTGFRIEVLPDESLPENGPGRASNGNFVLSEFQVEVSDTNRFTDKQTVALGALRADLEQKDFPAGNAVDGDEKTGWAIGPGVGAAHEITFATDAPVVVDSGAYLRMTLSQKHGGQHTIGRFRVTAMTGTDLDQIAPQAIRDVLAVDSGARSEKQQESLLAHHVDVDPAVIELRKELKTLEARKPKSPNMTVRVISQRVENPRTTHILKRGDFLRPQDEVVPGTLEILHQFSAAADDAASHRLDFARWLMDSDNPLTPRVAANQVWAHLFGAGLVATLNDFGTRGDRPAHPKLLDWLAGEYRRLGWSRKAFIKRIVMSSTYRQASTHRPELAESDPENTLLYRQNRFRVQAETVRDMCLAVSGLLSRKIGGPSVFPPMPPDVAELSYANNFKWKTSEKEDRYRRGMYTFFKRTAPHPNLTTFDCPDGNTTCVARRNSNTPLQALATLNNEVFVETSQALAKRMLSRSFEDDARRMSLAVRLCIARSPSEYEQDQLASLLDAARKWYVEHPNDATPVVGEYQPKDVPAAEAAAWVATTRMILNLDEFITRE